jgi:hypothetical protein
MGFHAYAYEEGCLANRSTHESEQNQYVLWKEGTFVQNVHSILAQNRFLKAPGNFSTNIPFSSMSIRALLSMAKG